jgi:prevent-host-death family protein
MAITISSSEFKQDPSGARKAAAEGPVLITDRGRPTHVLLTIEEYERITGEQPNMVELLAMPEGGDIEFDPPQR